MAKEGEIGIKTLGKEYVQKKTFSESNTF